MQELLPFGRWLKRLRAERDLTQEALADAVGCAGQTIRTFESGTRRPSRELAERLAVVLQLPAEQRADFVRQARAALSGSAAEQESPRRRDEGALPTPATSGGATASAQGTSNSMTGPGHTTILATKLYVPRARAELVPRPRLLSRLDAGLAGPLTLIAAPAGFGKTTILADWFRQKNQSSLNVAWLALDAGDSDLVLFLRYVIAALRTIAPGIGGPVLALLASAQTPPLQSVLPVLVNELTTLPEHSLLVLDDYHVIDAPLVHQALAFLLDHLPPQLRLVIASRVDPPLPLARLRARGQLTELRAHDLRFTADEAATFLREVMGLRLGEEDVAALEARTEGWIAGLQLAALAMRDRGDHTSFVRAFAGSNRFVVDYLVEEVIERLPTHLQTFVLQTSLLDRLCGPLCDAVLGVGDASEDASPGPQHSYSQALLAELERGNLFLIPLDDERRWYRYHHLFGEVVRARLQQGATADQVAELHDRASVWYEQEGLETEAIQHALASRRWEHAMRLLVLFIPTVVNRSQFHTAVGWLEALPDALLSAHPTLCVYHAGVLMYTNQVDAADLRLDDAERALAASEPGRYRPDEARIIEGHVAVIRGAIFRIRGDLERCVALSRQALALLPEVEPTPLKLRAVAGLNASRAFQVTGDVTAPVEQLATSIVARVRASGNRYALLTSITNLARLQVLAGRLRQGMTTYEDARSVAAGPGELQAVVGGPAYYFGTGDLLREWNDLALAADVLQSGMELVQGTLTVDADVITLGYIATARLQQAQGEHARSLQTLATFFDVARTGRFAAPLLARAAAAQAQLVLAQGDLAAAERWADAAGIRDDEELSFLREGEHLVLARLRIAQERAGQGSHGAEQALRLLDRLLATAEAGARMGSVIEILILQALALRLQGNSARALSTLERALLLAAPERYIRIFVDEGPSMTAMLIEAHARGIVPDFVATLLAANGGGIPAQGSSTPERGELPPADAPVAEPQSAVPLVEPLTAREWEVLRLLVAGHSNQAIAEELVVAVGTVKRHVNSILSKLQAQSRLEAVARARELALV